MRIKKADGLSMKFSEKEEYLEIRMVNSGNSVTVSLGSGTYRLTKIDSYTQRIEKVKSVRKRRESPVESGKKGMHR